MTSCDEIRISLGALAVSALDAEEELAVREHVAGCPRCAAELAELVETVGVLAAAKPVLLPAKVPPDPRVLDGLLGAVADERRRARRRRYALGLAAAAAGAVVAGAGVLLVGGDEAPPPAATATTTADGPAARLGRRRGPRRRPVRQGLGYRGARRRGRSAARRDLQPGRCQP